jgi:hypothetical protein
MAAKTKVSFAIVVAVVLALMLSTTCPAASAQTATVFHAGDPFVIRDTNGTITFSRSGNYTAATLESGAWHFTHLRLGSIILENFSISAENTNVNVFSFTNNFGFNTTFRSFSLTCNVTGAGKFTVDFGKNLTKSTTALDWFVVTRTGSHVDFLGIGHGWSFNPDGTITVKGVTGNMSISLYGNSPQNLPTGSFYDQHSVAITAAVVLIATVSIAVVVTRLQPNKAHAKQAEGLH